MMEMSDTTNYAEMFDCDQFRIYRGTGKMFLILGWKRNTKDDDGQWCKDWEQLDYDYIKEEVVASGETEAELLESAREYKRLSGMSIEDYLLECVGKTT